MLAFMDICLIFAWLMWANAFFNQFDAVSRAVRVHLKLALGIFTAVSNDNNLILILVYFFE